MTSLALKKLSKEYTPGKLIFSDISLDIPEGEMLALLGPSGSGKTTLLRLIAGLTQPTQGDIFFDNESVLSIPAEKRGAAMVFQEHSIFPFMSVGENIAFGLRIKKLSRMEISRRVSDVLARVRLSGFEHRNPAEISGGQRQRVALARALVINPKILLLDEPLSNLESALRNDLRQMIRDLQTETGITTIFVTHDQSEAVAVADRVALLLNCSLRQVGKPRRFFDQPRDVEVARFFGGTNFIQGRKIGTYVQTHLGEFEISPSQLPDGDVLLTIRPEAITIGTNGHNSLPAKLVSSDYRGLNTHCEFQVNGDKFFVSAPPNYDCKVGERTFLHLGKESIHVMPKEEKNEERK